jgi:hypothetical protein
MHAPSFAIKEPRWSRPALLDEGRSFRLIVASLLLASPTIVLRRGGAIVPVSVESSCSLGPGLTLYICIALGGSPGQLYDLEVQIEGQRSRIPHAVGFVAQRNERLVLLHCSDLHLFKPTPAGGLADRSALVQALVARINVVRPDLVVCTGDLVQRYDAQKKALPAKLIRWQIGHIRDLLSEVCVPLYVTIGNHDLAFEETRTEWYEVMGGGWNGCTDDFSLDWGDYHLAMMDCFAYYDGQNVQLESSFTNEQILWLRRDLSAASNRRRRLIFAHYDYKSQLPPLFEPLHIDALFYGHAKGIYPDVFVSSGVWDGHLDDSEAYNLVKVTADEIASEKVPWTELA